jgi:hypothetical protein
MFLFEFTQLEMNLGLFLCSLNRSPEQTKKINDMNFNKRLELLSDKVAEKFDGSPGVFSLYSLWIDDAHDLRELRNNFFHGRWGFDVGSQSVANVAGLPSSSSQESRLFTIAELQTKQEAIQELGSRLSKLRESNPLN